MKFLIAIVTLLLTSFSFLVEAKAESLEDASERLMIEEAYEAPAGMLFNEEAYFRGETALSQYVNVIVVNKAEKAQTLRLYTNRQLILTTKVSTGRENLEYITKWKGLVRRLTNGKGTTSSHWRHTTRGFYSVKRVEGADYKSGESQFKMPFAMFFNSKRGLAVHQVPPDLNGGEAAGEAQLGKRASSGCVRVHKNTIQDIHSAVAAADKGQIPVLDSRTGNPKLDARGKLVYEVGYRTIVIVEEY
jgi:lipoprotein-anchoring transpeptidase ErfK/SrfK